MHDTLSNALTAVAERLAITALHDAELRHHLRQLANAILAATEELSVVPRVTENSLATASEDAVSEAHPLVSAIESPSGMEAVTSIATDTSESPHGSTFVMPTQVDTLTTLTTSSRANQPDFSPGQRWAEVDDSELPLIEARCRLKAEGARWAATRRQRIAAGVDYRVEVEPMDRDIIERAKKLPDCFLWMCHPSGPSPSDLSVYEDVAGCFDAVASGVALARSLLGEGSDSSGSFEKALDLLAEAQSALRMSVAEIGGPTDSDQNKVFYWLRSSATQHQFFIQRFMRVDDPADPATWPDIGDRIQAVDAVLQSGRQREKRHQQSIGRVRFHLGQIAKGNGDPQHHWDAVVTTIDGVVQDGTPPSSTSIRELILPVIEAVPDMAIPSGFQLVMREIDRYLATRPSEQPTDDSPESTADVRAVAKMLSGKTIILIGGDCRLHAREAIKKAFELTDVNWIATREHESISNFEPHVARPEVVLVLLAIRWSSHVFGEVKQFCDRYGKPLVRLPGGYNPNQIAAQVLTQVSDKLRKFNSE